jgi:hypothetical protein
MFFAIIHFTEQKTYVDQTAEQLLLLLPRRTLPFILVGMNALAYYTYIRKGFK